MIKMWSFRSSAERGNLSVDAKHAASCVYVSVAGRQCWSESMMHSNTKAHGHTYVTMTISVSECV